MNSAGEVRIRLATSDDLDAIVLLDHSIDNLPHWSTADYRNALPNELTEPKRCMFVAEMSGRLVGLAVGVVNVIAGECSAELESVGVAVEMRRHGLGRKLCHEVVSWSQSHGAAHLDLEVRSRSSGPVALYRQLGFEVVGTRRGYYRDPADDAILMRLDLKATQSEAAPPYQPKR